MDAWGATELQTIKLVGTAVKRNLQTHKIKNKV